MAVNVQSESRRCVAQVFLHRLNVVPALDSRNCVRMAEVVKANCGSAYLLHDPLEAIIDCPIGKKAACGVREYQVAFRPAFPSLYPHSVLLQPCGVCMVPMIEAE